MTDVYQLNKIRKYEIKGTKSNDNKLFFFCVLLENNLFGVIINIVSNRFSKRKSHGVTFPYKIMTELTVLC